MSQFTFETAWPNPPHDIRDEVVEFWGREGVLSHGQASERAAQLLIVCRRSTGAVAGVSTAMPTFVERLGLRCFYFRSYIGKPYRTQGLRRLRIIHQVIRRSYDVLNTRFQQGIDKEMVGLYMEIENRSVKRLRNELVWTDLGANIVFTGMSPNGHHTRVWYFDRARLGVSP